MKLWKHTGALIVFIEQTVMVTGDRAQCEAAYKDAQTHNLLAGWWSPASILAWNWVALIRNYRAIKKVRNISQQQPQASYAQQAPPAPSQTPAGWYPDPSAQAGQRYWDGAQWTHWPPAGADLETETELDFIEATQGVVVPLRLNTSPITSTINVRFPAGVQDGQRIRLAGQGQAGSQGAPSGDLYVTVHVRPDKVFRRDGEDLTVTVPVSFSELALGATLTVPTLDGTVPLHVPKGTPDGHILRVRGRGVPQRGGGASDLLVIVKVAVPPTLEGEAREALQVYAAAERASGFNPRAGWPGKVLRDGDDITVTVPVSFTELALGSTLSVPALDGTIGIRVPSGFAGGRQLRVRGRGVTKRGGGNGDLLVTVNVAVPPHLEGEARDALEVYATAERASGFSPRTGWAGNRP